MKKILYLIAIFLLPTLIFFTLSRWWQGPETSSEVRSAVPQQHQAEERRDFRPGFLTPREKSPHEQQRLVPPEVATLERKGAGADTVPRLEITVVDAKTGSPIQGAKVVVLNQATRKEQISQVTDLEGKVSLRPKPGQYWVVAHHDDYLSNENSVRLDSQEASIHKTLGLIALSKVTGFLRNQHGATVANARISFWKKDDSRDEGSYSTTYTRQDGFFQLDVDPGSYVLQIVKLPSETTLESPVLVPAPDPLELTLNEELDLLSLQGRVVDTDSVPVADANVLLKRGTKPWPSLAGQSKTSPDGRFDMMVPPGKALLHVEARGYQEHEEVLELLENSHKRIVLRGFQPFVVRVHDSEGKRIENAMVLGRSLETSKTVVRSLEEKQGNDTLFYSTEYPFEIHATSSDQGLGFTKTRIIEQHQPLIELESSGQGRLSAYVTDGEGNPIRDFTISLEEHGVQRAAARVATNDGHFAFEGIPDGNYTVVIETESSPPQRKTVDIREHAPGFVEVILSRGKTP